MSSFENVEIFEDTKNLCEKNGRIKESLAKSVKAIRNCWMRKTGMM